MSRNAMLGPGTVTWRVNREGTLLAGGGRALLLQVAHPLVGAGVAQHSNYRQEPWQRLYRTMDTTVKIVFGDPETSQSAASKLSRRHAPVKGTAEDGRRYSALDPDLLLWVWATLVDTSVVVHELVFEPLSAADRETFLGEQHRFAHACGVPEGTCPATWADFRAYFESVLENDLRVTDAARDVADSIGNVPLPGPLRLAEGYASRLNSALTAGLLHPKLRAEYGYRWGPAEERRFRRAVRNMRVAARLSPGPLRRLPAIVLARPPREKSRPPARRRSSPRASSSG
jgi:uncharacterized protein (DUF2236 family)